VITVNKTFYKVVAIYLPPAYRVPLYGIGNYFATVFSIPTFYLYTQYKYSLLDCSGGCGVSCLCWFYRRLDSRKSCFFVGMQLFYYSCAVFLHL